MFTASACCPAGNDIIFSAQSLNLPQRVKPADSWSAPVGSTVMASGSNWVTYIEAYTLIWPGQAGVDDAPDVFHAGAGGDVVNAGSGSGADVIEGGAVKAVSNTLYSAGPVTTASTPTPPPSAWPMPSPGATTLPRLPLTAAAMCWTAAPAATS